MRTLRPHARPPLASTTPSRSKSRRRRAPPELKTISQAAVYTPQCVRASYEFMERPDVPGLPATYACASPRNHALWSCLLTRALRKQVDRSPQHTDASSLRSTFCSRRPQLTSLPDRAQLPLRIITAACEMVFQFQAARVFAEFDREGVVKRERPSVRSKRFSYSDFTRHTHLSAAHGFFLQDA